jgi:hypothetical protein
MSARPHRGGVPSAGSPLPALPEHDRVLLETADLPRRVLAADPGSSAWIHPTTGSPCAPCRTRHWSPRAWSRQPPQPALTDLKEPRSAGRSTVRDAGAPSCTQSPAADQPRSIRSSTICEVRSGLLPGSGGPQDVDQRSPCPPAHGAQNAQIWTASVVMAIEPTPAQIGGTVRVLLSFPITQRHALDRRNLESVLPLLRCD